MLPLKCEMCLTPDATSLTQVSPRDGCMHLAADLVSKLIVKLTYTGDLARRPPLPLCRNVADHSCLYSSSERYNHSLMLILVVLRARCLALPRLISCRRRTLCHSYCSSRTNIPISRNQPVHQHGNRLRRPKSTILHRLLSREQAGKRRRGHPSLAACLARREMCD